MSVENLMSHFKIRTKVLIFVIPFVILTAAIGIIGISTSISMRGRMEIANKVLQSLTGFKELYGAMNHFLSAPGERTREPVYSSIQQQSSVLREIAKGMSEAATGRAELQSTLAGTEALPEKIDALWKLHLREEDLLDQANGSLKALIADQATATAIRHRLEQLLDSAENDAKTKLRWAAVLNQSADYMTGLGSKFLVASSDDAKIGLAKDSFQRLQSLQREISVALPDSQKDSVQRFQMALSALGGALPRVNSGEGDIQEIKQIFAQLRQTSVYLQLGAASRNKEATMAFAALDQQVEQFKAILAAISRLDRSINAMRIMAAGFLIQPDESNRDALLRSLELVDGDRKTLFDSSKSNSSIYDGSKLDIGVKTAVSRLESSAVELSHIHSDRILEFGKTGAAVDRIWQTLMQFAQLQKEAADSGGHIAVITSLLVTVFGALMALAGGAVLTITVQRPIKEITSAMRQIADGSLDGDLIPSDRRDEIGEMATALEIFRGNALAKLEIEKQSDYERNAAEAERAKNDAERQELNDALAFTVNQLASGLALVARGDLTAALDIPFLSQLEPLRIDFNISSNRLNGVMSHILSNVKLIQKTGLDMADSADTLAQRTEIQVAGLEEAAAAVDEITASVTNTAGRAVETSRIVKTARDRAERSAIVMRDAITAMERISEASSEIEQIIDVIEQIAIQTNLLALNAGIEAARAGEAGNGFAVVAREVRELAQRSASAADQVKELINTSSAQVSNGSALISSAGGALGDIEDQIALVSQHVEAITVSCQNQASALRSVNGSVSEVDEITRKNAQMVTQASRMSNELSMQGSELLQLISRFTLKQTTARIDLHVSVVA